MDYLPNSLYSTYNENYETLPMSHIWSINNNKRQVEYYWEKSGIKNSIKIQAGLESSKIEPASITQFITEHYWGYAKINEHKSNEYEVTHPIWNINKVENYEINVDFRLVYGDNFDFLNTEQPHSVILADGSEISVENKKVIKRHYKGANSR